MERRKPIGDGVAERNRAEILGAGPDSRHGVVGVRHLSRGECAHHFGAADAPGRKEAIP